MKCIIWCHWCRGRGATRSRGSIDPHFSGAGSTYGTWPLTFCRLHLCPNCSCSYSFIHSFIHSFSNCCL